MASKRMDALVDEAVKETFPASDPPSYMAGVVVLGSPSRSGVVREPALTELSAAADLSEDYERRTRERAYFLWEQEGWPEGRADKHWRAAQRGLADEEASKT